MSNTHNCRFDSVTRICVICGARYQPSAKTPEASTVSVATGQTAHTPLPLKVAYVGNCGAFGWSIEDANGNQVALITALRDESNEERLARAEYIVTACNSFPALVEALKRALLWTDSEYDVNDWREVAEAVLAKAGSGQSAAVAPESDAVAGVSWDQATQDHYENLEAELGRNRVLFSALQASRDELLEALKKIERPFWHRFSHPIVEIKHIARAAIKKAEAIKDLGE